MNRWFGLAWNPNCCTPETHVETPVGELCLYCKEPIREGDFGMIMPIAGLTELAYQHHHCLMRVLDIDQFPPGYGANYRRPVVNVRHADLELDSPEDSAFRAQCPVCKEGVLRVRRHPTTLRVIRSDFCSRCVQRFNYTDVEINGETFHVPEKDVS